MCVQISWNTHTQVMEKSQDTIGLGYPKAARKQTHPTSQLEIILKILSQKNLTLFSSGAVFQVPKQGQSRHFARSKRGRKPHELQQWMENSGGMWGGGWLAEFDIHRERFWFFLGVVPDHDFLILILNSFFFSRSSMKQLFGAFGFFEANCRGVTHLV